MSVFAAKSPCCGAAVETRTDGPGGIGRTLVVCSRCDMMVPSAMAPPPARAPVDETAGVIKKAMVVSAPIAPPAPPRRVPPAEPPTPSTPMPSGIPSKGFAKKCARSGRPYTATGAAQKWCGTCPDCKAATSAPPPRAKAKPDKPAPRRPANTGFRAEPPKGGKNMYQPTIDALQEELDAIEIRRTDIGAAIEQLTKLGAA